MFGWWNSASGDATTPAFAVHAQTVFAGVARTHPKEDSSGSPSQGVNILTPYHLYQSEGIGPVDNRVAEIAAQSLTWNHSVLQRDSICADDPNDGHDWFQPAEKVREHPSRVLNGQFASCRFLENYHDLDGSCFAQCKKSRT
jgi:hypothetical protein